MKKSKIPLESVWDYPRPPSVQKGSSHIRIVHNDTLIADTNQYYRILETSHPPTIYIPREKILASIEVNERQSFCEYKGKASYVDILLDANKIKDAGWLYPKPNAPYLVLRDHVAFYSSKFDACYIGDEKVNSQEGDFYGGWITSNLKGPFKGPPGTWGW